MSTRLRLKRARALSDRMTQGSQQPSEALVAFLGELSTMSRTQIFELIKKRNDNW